MAKESKELAVRESSTPEHVEVVGLGAGPPSGSLGAGPPSGSLDLAIKVGKTTYTVRIVVPFGDDAPYSLDLLTGEERTAHLAYTVGSGNYDMSLGMPEIAFGEGNSLSGKFQVTNVTAGTAPVITSLSVAEGSKAGGTAVTIIGTGFDPGSRVLFGGKPCPAEDRRSTTTLVATSPASDSAKTVEVVVISADLPSAANEHTKFKYT